MASLHAQIQMTQREGSSTVTVTVTIEEAHSHQRVSHRVAKIHFERDALSLPDLDRQLVCYIERALRDLESPLPF